MKKLLSIVLMAILIGTLTACAEKKPEPEVNFHRSDVTSTVAIVEGLNLKKRMVTLRSLDGSLFDVHVGKEVINLPQVQVGDRVEINYSESITVRLAKPGTIRDESGEYLATAKPGDRPAAVKVNRTEITATILALHKTNSMAKLKLADGSIAEVTVENPENLDTVKVGDTISIEYLEVMSIQVQGQKK